MDAKTSWCAFEFEDIEIINPIGDNEEKLERWSCDQCSLHFLEKGKLEEHKKKHEIIKCKYCNKALIRSEVSKTCYVNKKCQTCEYRCSKCPKRFDRRSSLLNHEKNHSSPKKKKVLAIHKKVNGVSLKKIASSKEVTGNKKQMVMDDLEEQVGEFKPKKRVKVVNSPKNKQKVRTKSEIPKDHFENSPVKTSIKRQSLKSKKSSAEESDFECSSKETPKRMSQKANKSSTEKSQQVTATITSPAVSPAPNTPSNDTSVNYRPFSCHVCGNTFASDNALLIHIQTHGENATKIFKCKYCGDEFGDIYKMQYHLAICPLAEDVLEASFKQASSIKIPATVSKSPPSIRKRGRPKKSLQLTSEDENSESELMPPLPAKSRASLRKRKTDLENNETAQRVASLPPRKKPKSLSNELLSEPEEDNVDENIMNDTLSGAETDTMRDSKSGNERKKLHQCPFPRCDFKFTREKALLCHMRNHSDDFDDSLKCHKCDVPFEDLHTLRQHINMCKGVKEERDDDFDEHNFAEPSDSPISTLKKPAGDFECTGCGKTFQTNEELSRCTHEVSLECRLCGVQSESEKNLKKHFSTVHPKHLPYQCSTCQSEFDTALAKHEHSMNHVKETKHSTCVICSATFTNYKDLYFHYSRDHDEQSQSICKICNISLPSKKALEDHNYARHKTGKRFKCIFCPKSYSSSVTLSTHLKTHTTKIFKCKVCYRPFSDTGSLFQHMLFHASSFSTEKPLKCVLCLAAYSKKSGLRNHITRHLNKDSSLSTCPVCGETPHDVHLVVKHIFDHSIRITENNMTVTEKGWIEVLKENKSLIKRVKCINSPKPYPELRPKIKDEKDDPDFNPNVKVEVEPSPVVRQRRGRPRNQSENHEIETSPEPKQARLRPKKQPENQEIEASPGPKRGRGRPRKYPVNYSTSPPEHNNRESVEFDENIQIKEEEDNHIYENIPHLKQNKLSKSTKKADRSTSHVGKIEGKKNVSLNSQSTKVRGSLKRKQKEDVADQADEGDNKSKNKLLKNGYLIPKSETFTKTGRLRKKNFNKECEKQETTPSNTQSSLFIDKEHDASYTENKGRPMSFKMFSSRSNKPGNNKIVKQMEPNEKFNFESKDLFNFEEDFGNSEEEEDPLGGIEIPYLNFPPKKSLRSSTKVSNGWFSEESNQEIEEQRLSVDKNSDGSEDSHNFIKVAKYFEPSRSLTKYSCTTCLQSFSSQNELMFHNATHIF